MTKLTISTFALLLVSQLPSHAVEPRVIYGEDNRLDALDVKSELFLKLAESTAAQIPHSAITIRGSTAEIYGKPLKEWVPPGMLQEVCEKERFSAQPTASNCSGFFVGDDIIATAGHCMISESECKNFSWVRNYKISEPNQTAISVDVTDIFKCSQIIKVGHSGGLDFALIKLDRSLPGKAVKIAKETPRVGTPLVMIGFPSGLPQKISNGASIASVSGTSFRANLDAFGGNSGSAVFNSASGELVGILANGKTDYRYNESLDCSEVNILDDDQGGEGVSSFEQFISYL
jgi:V8-like Glu-specific endopeptidase